MPGTIQVSVLDLLEFPSSSSSTISIKVSMGKREFRTWDKGEFSFPLTTLRDNIIITIHDAEGKELSRTGVATMLVVEKGILDDFFVLEGGGRLHMKLQFILNSVERKRIQELREIALKKKQEEILIDRARHSEAAALASFRSNVGSSSMSLNHEVTDSSESLVQKEAESSGAESLRNADNRSKDVSDSLNEDGVLAAQLAHPDPIKNPLLTPSSHIKDSIPGTGGSQEILLDRSEEPIRSDINGGDDLSTVLLTEEPQIHHAKAEKQDTHSVSGTIEVDRDLNESKSMLPPNDILARPISSLEKLESRSSEDSVSSKFEEDQILNEDKTPGSPTDIPLRRISSLVELNSHPDTPVRLTSSFKDLANHSNSSKFGETQMLNKSKMVVPTTDFPLRRIASHGNFGEHSRSSKLEEDRVVIPEKPSVVKRTPSNVRKMISAFETSQAKGQVIRADPPIIRSQPIKSKFNISPAEPTVKEVMKLPNYIRERKDGGLEQNGKEARQKYKTEIAAEMGSRFSAAVKTQERNLQESGSEIRKQIPVSLELDGRDKLCAQEPSQEQLMEATTSPSQRPAVSRLLEADEHPNTTAQPRTSVPHIEKSIIVESACDKTKLVEDCKAKKHPVGGSRSCILTDQSRPLCITTGSKQLMNLVAGTSKFSGNDLEEKSSYETDVTNEQNLHHNTCNEVQKIGKASDDTRKSNLEGPQNVIEGLIGQAGKVAAIVAFGALVIFARER
ncbi:hypothetical protein MKX03_020674 [Papaver bracteatum]|nr:hypothetical protein MKX03_020674 [Papaver bracteatum]